MTTPFEVSTRAGHATQSSLSIVQTNTLRMALLVERDEQIADFTHHSAELAKLTADSAGDTAGRDRALAALHMYVTREAIEEIRDALFRIRHGDYGTCQSCGQPISFARLEMFPQARSCTACLAPSTLAQRAANTSGDLIFRGTVPVPSPVSRCCPSRVGASEPPRPTARARGPAERTRSTK